jgi:hypothetical protein
MATPLQVSPRKRRAIPGNNLIRGGPGYAVKPLEYEKIVSQQWIATSQKASRQAGLTESAVTEKNDRLTINHDACRVNRLEAISDQRDGEGLPQKIDLEGLGRRILEAPADDVASICRNKELSKTIPSQVSGTVLQEDVSIR